MTNLGHSGLSLGILCQRLSLTMASSLSARWNTFTVGKGEFIVFTNTQYIQCYPKLGGTTLKPITKGDLRVAEIDFPKPQPGESLTLFWKLARGIIR